MQCENEPLPPPFLQALLAVKRFYIILFKNIACTQSHSAGSLREQRRASKNWEELAIKTFGSKAAANQLPGATCKHSDTPATNHTHTHTLTQAKELFKERSGQVTETFDL